MSLADILVAAAVLGAAYVIYLDLLATFVVHYRPVYTHRQRLLQTLAVWLVPLFGALLVLRLLFHDRPDTRLPQRWIPWPFRAMVLGVAIRRYDDAPPRRGFPGNYGN